MEGKMRVLPKMACAVALLGTSIALAQDSGIIHRSKASNGAEPKQFTISRQLENVVIHYYVAYCVHDDGGWPIGAEIHIAKEGGSFSRTLRHTEAAKPSVNEVVRTEGPFWFPPGTYSYTVNGIGHGSDLKATGACIGEGEACGPNPFEGTTTSC
jgi:hypothetical protein